MCNFTWTIISCDWNSLRRWNWCQFRVYDFNDMTALCNDNKIGIDQQNKFKRNFKINVTMRRSKKYE